MRKRSVSWRSRRVTEFAPMWARGVDNHLTGRDGFPPRQEHMHKTLWSALALAAGLTASALPALAQDVTPLPPRDKSTIPHITIDARTNQALPYASRLVTQDVYDSDANGQCIGTFGHNHLLEDVW